MHWKTLVLGLVVAVSGLAPGQRVPDLASPAPLVVDSPAEGTIFPPDLAAPTFLWHDPSAADLWRVEVAFPDGGIPRLQSVAVPVRMDNHGDEVGVIESDSGTLIGRIVKIPGRRP